jgi:hypothetical protein
VVLLSLAACSSDDGASCSPGSCSSDCIAHGYLTGTCSGTTCNCSGGSDADADGDGDADADADADADGGDTCTPGAVECDGTTMQACNDTGHWDAPVACADPTPACTPGVGCTVCTGNDGMCAGDVASRCMPDGSGWFADDTCDTAAGERCIGGYCTDMTGPCEDARVNNSYEGCDYFVVSTVNSTLLAPDVFRFAIVVGNRNADGANVRVYDGDVEVGNAVVASNGTATIELPWKNELRTAPGSRLVTGGAYRVRSDLPVTVYQFNPLRYWEESRPLYPGSYTNDASLVLPRNVLSGRYLAMARESFKKVDVPTTGPESPSPIPGFIAVVGTRDGTNVTLTFSANTKPGTVPAYGVGDTAEFTLNKGDVLQILSYIPDDCPGTNWRPGTDGGQVHYCQVGREYDLTGTQVSADKPVALFGGHDCTFVPYDRWACDHLEEQIYPLEAWGRRYIGARTQQILSEGNIWRVLSATDGNEIRFTPTGVHAPVTLARGEYVEFESSDDFLAEGTGPMLLAQYLMGEGDDMSSIGDPSMGLAVPIEQFRTEYNFLSPEDYQDLGPRQRGQNWVDLIVPAGASAWLDGVEYTDFAPVGDTGYGVARIQVSGGSHALIGSEKIGITCYGYGNYTSYLYPGGLNVDPINTVIIF